ncbi:MAG: TRAP transporter substrate-binding protein [Lachnospiraceae bacterium]|nr:TRAP transporter substrate-binding protein [Lachnospiraceae bacterium]
MKKKLLVLVLAAITVAATGCGSVGSTEVSEEDLAEVDVETTSSDAEVIIRISNGSSASAPFCVAQDEVFKPYVEEALDGTMAVEVYYSNQLGSDTASTESLRAGDLEMNCTSTAPLVGLVPELGVFDIPFLFSSYEQADYVIDGGLGDYLTEKINTKGVYVIAWCENGFRNLTTVEDHPVTTPDDLSGLKIRTMENDNHIALWNALGASATPIDGSQIYTSLQSGVVDGQENPIPNFYAQQIHEVSPNITITEHIYSPMLLLYSSDLFDQLTEDQQAIIMEAGAEYSVAEREENRTQSEEILAELEADEDYNVIELTSDEKQAFIDLTVDLQQEIKDSLDSEVVELLDQLLEESSDL